MSHEERFDGLFMNAVQQAQGIDNFFDSMFGFFGRRTDLYTDEHNSRLKMVAAYEKHLKIFQEKKGREAQLAAKKQADKMMAEKKKREEDAKKKAAAESGEAQCEELTEEEAAKMMAEEAAKKAGAAKPTEEKKSEEKDGEEGEDKGQKPNAENGGETDKYMWTQTLSEVTVNLGIGANIKGNMLKVEFKKSSCKIAVKNGETILEGEWGGDILVDDAIWTIESHQGKRVLQLSLTKVNQMGWWDCVIKGEGKIDTGKVDPENSKLSDLDGETRSTVEKMMYDQNQKQKGLPTSEEQEKKNKLAEFMKAHPEMDFSQAKFC